MPRRLSSTAALPLVFLVCQFCRSNVEARPNSVLFEPLQQVSRRAPNHPEQLRTKTTAFLTLPRGGNLESMQSIDVEDESIDDAEQYVADISRAATTTTTTELVDDGASLPQLPNNETAPTDSAAQLDDSSTARGPKNPLVNRWKRFQDGRKRRKEKQHSDEEKSLSSKNATVHEDLTDTPEDQSSVDPSNSLELSNVTKLFDTNNNTANATTLSSIDTEFDNLQDDESHQKTELGAEREEKELERPEEEEQEGSAASTLSSVDNNTEQTESLSQTAEPPVLDASETNDEENSTITFVDDDDDTAETTSGLDDEEAEEVQATEPVDKDESVIGVTDQNQTLSASELYDRTQTLRKQGKELHDSKYYEEAAQSFALAAEGLEYLRQRQRQAGSSGEGEQDDDSLFDLDIHRVQEDTATCRLHESLCLFKAEQFEEAVEACNQVIMIATQNGLSPAVRARALYRRAKARLSLEQYNEATQDARSAAFMGDDKAVDLYGQLLRENKDGSSASLMSSTSGLPTFGGNNDSFEVSPSSSDSPTATDGADLFSALMGGSTGASDDAASSMFAKSLLSSALSSGPSGEEVPSPFGISSLLGNTMGGGGVSGIVKSLGSSLTNERVHDKICSTLQGASKTRIQQYAGVAGVDISESQAERLANACQRIKPKHLKTTVSIGKRLWYCGQLIRKTSAVLTKYRPVLVLIFLMAWIKTLFS